MVDSRQAWLRLIVALIVCTIGGVGMWSVVVALPSVQAEFGVSRAEASFAYTLTMAGYSLGGVAMGRLADRFGVAMPILFGTAALGLGYLAAGLSDNIWQFALAQGLLIAALGSSATFGPLMADTSLWFLKRRGLAVAICASGNYIAGAIWPPVITHFTELYGWRATHMGIGVFCVLTMVPMALMLRRRPPIQAAAADAAAVAARGAAVGLSPGMLQTVLVTAGLSCCIAMSMPQVHIVSYCADLGYGVARGAEMLSLMLACGVISRLASGFIADRIGGLQTLLLGSFLQMVALCLYLISDGLTSLYIVSALFGLFQGGIIPSYAIVARSLFPAAEAGARVGIVLMSTIAGMAVGGWLSGAIFDLTGSYQAAFLNGIAWNLVNVALIAMLLFRVRRLTRSFA